MTQADAPAKRSGIEQFSGAFHPVELAVRPKLVGEMGRDPAPWLSLLDGSRYMDDEVDSDAVYRDRS
jgi:hypothetical protein